MISEFKCSLGRYWVLVHEYPSQVGLCQTARYVCLCQKGVQASVLHSAATCRQMFVNHTLAKIAAKKELQEAQARIDVQQQLSAAQAQAAQRAIVVVREKAANEAKSEFMSLMCHEVRTPLNGCLASAEMLLEMPLQVSLLLCWSSPSGIVHYLMCCKHTSLLASCRSS